MTTPPSPTRPGGLQSWLRPFGRVGATTLGIAVLLAGSAAVMGRTSPEETLRSERFRPGGVAMAHAGRSNGRDAHELAACLRAGGRDRGTVVRAQLTRLFETLEHSAAGRALVDVARRRGVQVCLDSETDLLAYYFAGARVIGVSSGLSEGGRIVFLAHELAHVPQHPAYSDNRYFPAGDLLLLRRMREATAEAAATRVAWELREAGHRAAWREKLATAYRDVAEAFARAAAADPGEEGLLRATRAAFDQWFEARWRRNVYDRMTLDHIERISDDSLGLVPPRYTLSDRFLRDIAWVAGRNFIVETGVPDLTAARYARRVSDRNATDLRLILDRAGAAALLLRATLAEALS